MRTLAQFLCLGLGLCLLSGINQAFSQPNFTPYENNPIIAYGSAGAWDSGIIFLPDVVVKDGLYYLFYQGSPNLMTTPLKVGYATSSDGFTWTKYSGNPIFAGDGTGFDAFMVAEATILLEDSLWVMYYNARSVPGPGPGAAIGRATATNPAGTWTRLDTPVLQSGSAGEWDAAFVTPNTIIKTDTNYIMYYSGGTGYPFPPSHHAQVGMATSPDGIKWTKYDDPATTNPPFAESDPVLRLGAPGSYDSGLAWECDVLRTENGWEMFYTGDPDTWSGERLSYATSSDGINWVKDPNNPFLGPTQPWATLELVAPSVIKIDGTYFMYYIGNTTLFNGQIGLATGTIITSVESESPAVAKTYQLLQNYPNPFNPQTQIRFVLQENERVNLQIFNLRGQKIATLLDGALPSGRHAVTWNSHDETGRNVASGIYLYRLQAGNLIQTRKMTLLR